jgi:hypothetical protein
MARAGRGFPVTPTFTRGTYGSSTIVTPARIAAVVAVPTSTAAPGTTASPARINVIARTPFPPISISSPTVAGAIPIDVTVNVPIPDVTPAPFTPTEIDPEYAWVHSISVLSSAVPV